MGGAGKHCRVHRTTDGSELFAGKHDDFVLSIDVSPDGTRAVFEQASTALCPTNQSPSPRASW